jgi:hypothetical protein
VRRRRNTHQVRCPDRTLGPLQARFLAVSTSGDPDIVIYPDSGKTGAFERLADGGGPRAMFRVSDAVDYHDGERPPAPE